MWLPNSSVHTEMELRRLYERMARQQGGIEVRCPCCSQLLPDVIHTVALDGDLDPVRWCPFCIRPFLLPLAHLS